MSRLTVIALFFALFILAILAPVNYTNGDPLGSLLVSRSLVTEGNLDLDEFPEFTQQKPSHLFFRGDHQYYFFPPGTSLLAVPAVGIALTLGLDPMDKANDRLLQRLLAALFFACNGLLLMQLALRKLPLAAALTLVAAFLLGTGCIANTATGLRSHGPVILCSLAALILLTREAGSRPTNALLGGLLLGFAVWCRPTALIGVLCGPLILLPERRRDLLLCWGAAAFTLVLILPFFRLGYGMWIHPYYLPGRIEAPIDFWPALAGQLFSPSRGQLTTAPWLLPLLLWSSWRLTTGPRRMVFLTGLSWWILMVAVTSRFPNWVAGHSFGNRFLLDALPALVLPGREMLASLLAIQALRWRRAALGAGSLLIVAGVWINTAKGAYDRRTSAWNGLIEIHHHKSRAWDWRDTQWLVNDAMVERLRLRRVIPPPEAVLREADFVAASTIVRFHSFNALETSAAGGQWRWSQGEQALVIWRYDPTILRTNALRLELVLGSYGQQTIEVILNGHPLGNVQHRRFKPATYSFPLKGHQLRDTITGMPSNSVVLVLRPSDPAPAEVSSRRIGVSFWGARLTAISP